MILNTIKDKIIILKNYFIDSKFLQKPYVSIVHFPCGGHWIYKEFSKRHDCCHHVEGHWWIFKTFIMDFKCELKHYFFPKFSNKTNENWLS